MRIAIHECKHCGDEYMHQCSGNYDAVDTPREYRDEEYCPECKKAIVEALKIIPVKFEYKNVPTDEVDLETLLRWEKEHILDYEKNREEAEKEGRVVFPLGKRVFASLFDWEKQESRRMEQVVGRGDKKGRIYIYSYWPSNKSDCKITVERKINLLTGELGAYKIQN